MVEFDLPEVERKLKIMDQPIPTSFLSNEDLLIHPISELDKKPSSCDIRIADAENRILSLVDSPMPELPLTLPMFEW